jgi:hypothetical protein
LDIQEVLIRHCERIASAAPGFIAVTFDSIEGSYSPPERPGKNGSRNLAAHWQLSAQWCKAQLQRKEEGVLTCDLASSASASDL